MLHSELWQVLDCSYNGHDRDGCHGASAPAYAWWLEKTRIPLVAERTYPKPRRAGHSGHCHQGLRPLKPRVSVTKAFYNGYHGGGRNLLVSESKMKRLVFEHGAVSTIVEVGPNSYNYGHYKHGVFAGCPRQSGALSLVQIVEILSSHWLNHTMLAPRSMP